MQEPAHVPGAETRPLVIANPAAGSGRTGRGLSQLLAAIRGAVGDLDVAETGRRGDAAALAAAAARDRRPLVIGLGGDGTLDEIVNGLLGAPAAAGLGSGAGGAEAEGPGPDAASLPALGIVGTGTGGDFGRSLGIPHELGRVPRRPRGRRRAHRRRGLGAVPRPRRQAGRAVLAQRALGRHRRPRRPLHGGRAGVPRRPPRLRPGDHPRHLHLPPRQARSAGTSLPTGSAASSRWTRTPSPSATAGPSAAA